MGSLIKGLIVSYPIKIEFISTKLIYKIGRVV